MSDLPREAGQSLHFDEAASVLRVAHVPQKPWYVIFINMQSVSAIQPSLTLAFIVTFVFDLPAVLFLASLE